jgi:aspartate/methionine/tyrosine aminotransferase
MNTKIRVSKRSERFHPQPMFEIMRLAKYYELKGNKIIHLEIGDTSNFENKKLSNLIKKNVNKKNLGYTLSQGDFLLRKEISNQYNKKIRKKINEDNVVISPANALVTTFLSIIADKKDSILIPDPGFPTYQLSCEALGLKKIFYRLNKKNSHIPQIDEIENKIKKNKKRLKAIIINTPSNPLGNVIPIDTVGKIFKLAKKYNIYCIFDETYKNLIYLSKNHLYTYFENLILIHTFSKEAAVPGLRMGFGIAHERIISRAANLNSLFFSCQPLFIQKSIHEYIKTPNKFTKKLKESLKLRSAKCTSILQMSDKIEFVKPEGGIFIFINISKLGLDGNEFSKKLLDKKHVCVCPGLNFGPSGVNYVRINLAGDEKELYRGCKSIVDLANSL